MASLSRRVDVGAPWFGKICLGGIPRTILAAASAPPGPAGALLMVILDKGVVQASGGGPRLRKKTCRRVH